MGFIKEWKIKRLKNKINSLVKARERLQGHWCGTPRLQIEEEIVKYYFKLKKHVIDMEIRFQEERTIFLNKLAKLNTQPKSV